MKFFQLLQAWFKKAFQRKSRKFAVENSNFLPEEQPKAKTHEIIQPELKPKPAEEDKAVATKETVKPIEATDKDPLPLPKEFYQACKIDFNTYKLFFPNWGELDPTVSTISDGRIRKEFINYLYDEFVSRYGTLTTNLGYGLIYSIVMNAIEKEDRTVSSALREAIVRSNDPLLCVAVVKDYCFRKAIHFNKYEKITLDILKRREAYYTKPESKSVKTSIDFTGLPPLSPPEQQDLDKSSWLFNGTIITIEPLYLIVKIPTLNDSQLVREFNKSRHFKPNQNVVIQCDGEDNYRVLDFK